MAFRLFQARLHERQKEEALRESEERYRSLVEHTSDAVFCYEYDPPISTKISIEKQVLLLYTGRLVECNVEAARYYGSEHPQDVIGKKLSELFGAAPGSQVDAMFEEFIHNDYHIIDGEGVEQLPDGTKRYFLNNAHGVIENGELIRIWGAYRDDTERKQAEEALHKSEEKYRNLYNNAEVAMFRTKLDGSGFIDVNDKLCDIIGYKRDELIGRPTSINWADLSEREEMVRRLDVEEYVKGYEWKLLTKSGDVRNCLTSLKLYRENGILEGSFIDITERKRAEEALHESEQSARALLNAIPDLIFRLDRQGVFLDYKAEKGDLYTDSTEIIGKRNRDLTPPEFADLIDLQIQATLETGETQHFEYQLPIPRRGIRNYEARMFPSGADEVITIVRDVTESKQAEMALSETEGKFRSLFEKSPIPLCFVNSREELEYFNQGFIELFGYDHADVPTMAEWWLHAYPDETYRQLVVETWNKAVEKSERNHIDIEAIEYRVKCKNGDILNVEIGGIVLENGFLATFVDVTERRRIEDELREVKERYDYTTMVGKVGTWDWNIPTGHLVWNDETYRLLGFEPGSITPRYELFLELVHPDDREFLDSSVKAAWYEKKPYSVDCRIVLEGSQEIICNATGKVEFDSRGQPIRMLGTFQDITERKKTEEALKKAYDEKQALLRELQHRAKNSFAMIASLTNLMSDTPRSKKCKATLSELGERVRAMAELYDLLYDTESATEARLDHYFARITAALPSSGHISFVQDYETVTVPVRIAAPLGLILTELVTNAIKHAFPKKRSGRINVELQKTATGALLIVSDDGIGVPASFAVEKNDSLGLMIVKSLVQQVNGNFQIESGQGTHCTVEFPL